MPTGGIMQWKQSKLKKHEKKKRKGKKERIEMPSSVEVYKEDYMYI